MCEAPFDRFCEGYDGDGLSAEMQILCNKYKPPITKNSPSVSNANLLDFFDYLIYL